MILLEPHFFMFPLVDECDVINTRFFFIKVKLYSMLLNSIVILDEFFSIVLVSILL